MLLWDGDDRTYRVSAQGHGALVQFAEGDEVGLGFLTAQLAGGALTGRVSRDHLQQILARLTELEDDFAAAVRSASELQLTAAQARLESVFLWMEKGEQEGCLRKSALAGRRLMCHNTHLRDTSRNHHAYRDHP